MEAAFIDLLIKFVSYMTTNNPKRYSLKQNKTALLTGGVGVCEKMETARTFQPEPFHNVQNKF